MQITRLTFLNVGRNPPPEIGLPELKTFAGTASAITHTLQPLLHPNAVCQSVDNLADAWPDAIETGICCVYVMGHGWPRQRRFETSIARSGVDQTLSGVDLIAELGARVKGMPALVFFDTCHAGLLVPIARTHAPSDATFVFACGPDEQTEEYLPDDRTRFSLRLDDAVARLVGQPRISLDELVRALSEQAGRSKIEYVATIDAVQARPPLAIDVTLQKQTQSRR